MSVFGGKADIAPLRFPLLIKEYTLDGIALISAAPVATGPGFRESEWLKNPLKKPLNA